MQQGRSQGQGGSCQGQERALGSQGPLSPHKWGEAGAGSCALRVAVASSEPCLLSHRWFFSTVASAALCVLSFIAIMIFIFVEFLVNPAVLRTDPQYESTCCCFLLGFPSGFSCVLASPSSPLGGISFHCSAHTAFRAFLALNLWKQCVAVSVTGAIS